MTLIPTSTARRLVLALTCIAAAALLRPPPVAAAYTTATVHERQDLADGNTRVVWRFTGNAGEAPVFRDLIINGDTTPTTLRAWGIKVRDSLNNVKTVVAMPALQQGQSIDLTDIVVTPTDPNVNAWRAKARQLAWLESLGTPTGSAGGLLMQQAIATLRGEVESDYAALTAQEKTRAIRGL